MQERLARLSYNKAGWIKPTPRSSGEADSEYIEKYGYGNEDWLFQDEWVIGGWRYAFIQGVNKSRNVLLRAGEDINVTLFTVDPKTGERFYVGRIEYLECITREQAQEAAVAFRDRGWLAQMRCEIKDIGGRPEALGNGEFTDDIHNVRYRLERLTRLPAPTQIADTDPIVANKREFTRFQLFHIADSSLENTEVLFKDERRYRTGAEAVPKQNTLLRRRTGGLIEVSLEHLEMQRLLIQKLKLQFPEREIIAEEDYIDILVAYDGKLSLYEIKSDLNPTLVIREAVGQLLEYAFFRRRKSEELELFIVGRRALSSREEEYLSFLQKQLLIPIEYIFISI